MFDFRYDTAVIAQPELPTSLTIPRTKVMFDRIVALLLLGPLIICAAVLAVLNPFVNAGSLIFTQKRMGQNCKPFTMIKFRTMHTARQARGAFDRLESERVTPLGQFLRRSRIDELPQIINVLRGEMSLIGPRPDCYDHALVYLRDVPGYAARQGALPGISGYAQTELGYIDDMDAMRRRVAADLYYIAHASFGFDLRIAWRTLGVVMGRRGA
ncbi:Sugar transferase involved in LPS biosynthesis (colanic, teichoic acid) [Yoonia tamlensis]|uniref:Sugar transferase involved in LPS biosynthesis (Colanic, teichoic acid) n=1 Tax=Yoonia tamlensis TaxID=390270 RepID=A0A1I6GQW4_9RHOB|nr:sugar transferase [Yoonia tamlensis]SFR44633.1 Sugar transferase involved in LPS biosynthesis (colanic, teichoic acid) [Yoonia tamlensis]